jgi:L-threonylcarbamoyladenylate synthase
MFNTLIDTDISIAKKYLEEGETVGIPTETVYGLAANALNEDAVLKIFSVKERPHFDPLIVHVHSKEEIKKYTTDIPYKAAMLMEFFMPGPLTLLLKKKNIIPDLVTSGLDTVAIRVPNHPLTLSLLQQLDFPLAAPSANPFGYISPTTAQHVYDQLQGKIPYILDGGDTAVGVESTIIGFEGDDEAIIYRLGGLAVEEIGNVIGRVVVRTNIPIAIGTNPKSPGMLASHYAPRKKLVTGEPVEQLEGKVAVIAFNEPVPGIAPENQVLLSSKGDLNEAAKNLFATMRRLDASDADIIYAVEFPDEGLGKAINDRLKRASA